MSLAILCGLLHMRPGGSWPPIRSQMREVVCRLAWQAGTPPHLICLPRQQQAEEGYERSVEDDTPAFREIMQGDVLFVCFWILWFGKSYFVALWAPGVSWLPSFLACQALFFHY